MIYEGGLLRCLKDFLMVRIMLILLECFHIVRIMLKLAFYLKFKKIIIIIHADLSPRLWSCGNAFT